jgi:hypothetical protein
MALRPDQKALPKNLQADLDVSRNIDNYTLRYLSEDFPLLGFVYATLAGGEHAIYCDHTMGFAARYLTKPLPDDLVKVLTSYEQMRGRDPAEHPSDADLRVLVETLLSELKEARDKGRFPMPLW